MKARIASVAGSVIALVVVGGFAAASTFQPAPERVPIVAPTVVVATVEPTVAPVAPVVAPTTVVPAPVASKAAPAPAVAPKEAAPVVKTPSPAPVQTDGNDPAFVGRYADGTPVKKDASGAVIPLPPVLPSGGSTNPPQTIPTL